MPFGLKRETLQLLAKAKLADAQLLLGHQRWSSAYYLAGYAAEIGLKACISRQFVQDVIPEKAFVQAIYSHKLTDLVGLAGLTSALRTHEVAHLEFAAAWAMVAQWTVESRYEATDMTSAQLMLESLCNPLHGVFGWIETHW